jgi:gamma-glutamyl:cysteine ligase YbdK (ATP-grasp superfamily)
MDESFKALFNKENFQKFNRQLIEEYVRLNDDIVKGVYNGDGQIRIGHELEGYILDNNLQPARISETEEKNTPGTVTSCPFSVLVGEMSKRSEGFMPAGELGGANYELNTKEKILTGEVFSREEKELLDKNKVVNDVLNSKNMHSYLTGIPETSTEAACSIDRIVRHPSKEKRYRGINYGVLSYRGEKILISLQNGTRSYEQRFDSIMPEAICTSFQQHLQMTTPSLNGHRYINAAAIVAAPLIAISANSPFVNGTGPLWKESRIPVFEQSIDSRNNLERTFGSDPGRGSFLSDYYSDLREYYAETLRRPALIPDLAFGKGAIAYPLLRLQLGTDWRWIRPVWHGKADSENKYITLEFRPLSAGPTIKDMMSNSALYYGAMTYLLDKELDKEFKESVPFENIRSNFYTAAKYGLERNLVWRGNDEISAVEVLEDVFEMSRQGLRIANISEDDIGKYLAPVKRRIEQKMCPADWKINVYESAVASGKDHYHGLVEIVRQTKDKMNANEPVI